MSNIYLEVHVYLIPRTLDQQPSKVECLQIGPYGSQEACLEYYSKQARNGPNPRVYHTHIYDGETPLERWSDIPKTRWNKRNEDSIDIEQYDYTKEKYMAILESFVFHTRNYIRPHEGAAKKLKSGGNK